LPSSARWIVPSRPGSLAESRLPGAAVTGSQKLRQEAVHLIFPLASDGVFGVYIVMPDLVTRTVPIPLSWRLETAASAAAALPLFPPPEPAGLPPAEPHAATTTAAAARPDIAVPCLKARRGARPACPEPVPGAAGRCVPAMKLVLLVPVTLAGPG
jgi:hypothetical protein